MVTKQQAIAEIEAHVEECGHAQYGWYVGITKDPRGRLFGDHGVSEKNGAWIYRETSSAGVARDVETYFLAKGFQGGEGGGDAASVHVYAYKITASTTE